MKPILFNTEMVRAILDGRKTVTRRVIKFPEKQTGRLPSNGDRDYLFYPCGIKRSPCRLGDILYVRETWKPIEASYPPSRCTIEYKAGGTKEFDEIIDVPQYITPWRPSIHMPKEAARIFLRVKNVRVERLQDITGEEIVKEGISREPLDEVGEDFFKGMFHDLWDSTIKKSDISKYGWDANPWVWVIEFERISKEDALK